MLDVNTICLVKNRSSSKVAYVIENEGIRREFAPGETKNIKYGELEKLSYTPGGTALMTHFLQIKAEKASVAEEVTNELNIHTEPEYHMSEAEIKEIILNGSIDRFMDMMDFAPRGVIDLVKKFAVELPMESTPKIEYLKEKTGFDLVKALANIKAEKADEEAAGKINVAATGRRVAVKTPAEEVPAGRRTTTNYKVVSKAE